MITRQVTGMNTFAQMLADCQSILIHLLRVSIFIVMAWIGGLKAFQYEAESIVPFVANSPLMRFLYRHPNEYNAYKNKEGESVPRNFAWHQGNNTYVFAYGLGLVIISIGVLTLSGIWSPRLGLAGGLLTACMSLVTLSFLITTPEAYVPDLGGSNHGFPFLSGTGRLVVKDVIMLAAGLVVASDSAGSLLSKMW
ncbi:reactive chlorine resistance membrane protein RclC [Dyadobacter sp. CY261]|uniref:reactive chlorine resistance membrane protein RclC n=1 Tax=Dyadobacter sp. CY261 TaxID=2907203 RepID=UPI001F2E79DC|nr:reactive chlorine resistance membrane protein RclC [Dyadobacter sp. CY261]MCF0075287.1 reactive chlorine resistance membrane protein RclC [Dyadobacter sp. CY261]